MSLIVDIKKKLKGFTLNMNLKTDGEYLGLLGASGSGKSMTLKCIAGVETPNEGHIILNGKTLFDSEKKINLKPQNRNVGYLFQNYALFPHMTVEENIGMGLKLPVKEKKSKVNEIIEAFHLQGIEKKYPNKISGGQQQRVALGRAIIYEPDILMLDEPFSALDLHLKEQLQNGIQKLLEFYKGDILMVSHSRDEIYRLCKKIAIIENGKNILTGTTKQIFKSPGLSTAARLIGCQNISKCQILSSHSLYASDWDIVLETEKEIPLRTKYVGIRAEGLRIVDSKKIANEKNIIKCKIDNLSEDILEYNILLKNSTSVADKKAINILFKVNKNKWNNREDKKNLYLIFPKNEILLLE